MGWTAMSHADVSHTDKEVIESLIVDYGNQTFEKDFYLDSILGFTPLIVEDEHRGKLYYRTQFIFFCNKCLNPAFIEMLDEKGCDYYADTYQPDDDCYSMDDAVREDLKEMEQEKINETA